MHWLISYRSKKQTVIKTAIKSKKQTVIKTAIKSKKQTVIKTAVKYLVRYGRPHRTNITLS